jgi:hypothetical protein
LDNLPTKIIEKKHVDSPVKHIEEQSQEIVDIRLKLKDRTEKFKKYLEKKHIDSPVKHIEEQSQEIVDIRLKLKDVDVYKIKYYQKDSIHYFIRKSNSFKKYKKLTVLFEAHRNEKPHFVKSSKERQESLTHKFSELSSLYFNLSKGDKKKAKRPIYPHNPCLRLMKNNKVFYRLKSNLTAADKLLIPPPPPVPNASKEEVLKAKNAYNAWKKRTGNDNAPPPPMPKPLKKN